MSDRQLLLLIWAIVTVSAALQTYTFAAELLRRHRLARAEKNARRIMKAMTSATIVAFRPASAADTSDEDAHRVH